MKEPTQRSTEFMTMKNRDKIYDCFCFFNEFDILDLRLNILDPYVDYFVICESSVTHTGAEKPFYFEEFKDDTTPRIFWIINDLSSLNHKVKRIFFVID